MNDVEFLSWSHRLHISEDAYKECAYIRQRSSGHGDHLQVDGASVLFHSIKMQDRIFIASQTLLDNLKRLENDPEVLEYYYLPPPLRLNFTDSAGRETVLFHTADAFAFFQDAAGWVEWKREAELHDMAKRFPDRYRLSTACYWHFSPGEVYAARFGFFYLLLPMIETVHR